MGTYGTHEKERIGSEEEEERRERVENREGKGERWAYSLSEVNNVLPTSLPSGD
jgi:hypothetical protein